MKKLLFILLLLLAGCQENGKEEIKTDNPNFKVVLLFEVEGCKVYRFYDDGYKYFTTSPGSTFWKDVRSHGKAKSYTDYEIKTF